MNLARDRILKALAPAMVLLVGLFMTGCGGGDAGATAVSSLKKKFTSGDIFEHLSGSERLAFAHFRNRGFSSKGSYIVEANGVEYRFVRVVFIDKLESSDLENEEKVKLLDERSFNLVKDGDIVAVARVQYEVIPSRKFLRENASEIVLRGGGGTGLREYYLYKGSKDKNWSIAERIYDTAARKLITTAIAKADAGTDNDKALRTNLRRKLGERELADRLLTKAPESDE